MSTVHAMDGFIVERLCETDVARLAYRRVVSRLLSAGDTYWKRYHTFPQLLHLLEIGALQFWTVKEQGGGQDPFLGFMTQVDEYGLCRVVRIIWLGGQRLGRAIKCISVVEKWARDTGCAGVEIVGRDAWVKLLAPQGYVKSQVVLYKPTSDENGGL